MGPSRRQFIVAAGGALAGCSQPRQYDMAQSAHAAHGGMYERLNAPGRVGAPELAKVQGVFDSMAPTAARSGRWSARAPLPLPRSEMAWAVAMNGRMHLVGGYGEQRVDRPYHHVYDPGRDAWQTAAPLPLGANHVGVAVLDGTLFAIGGFTEQNRKPHAECFAWSSANDQWRRIAPLPAACGSVGCVVIDGRLHGIGGAVGDSFDTKKSSDWHLVYDPQADRWSRAAPLPTARDHVGAVVANGFIHVIGGRVDSFNTNSNLHHAWDPATDKWKPRNPLPTARSGHGAVLVGRRIFVMGGEGTNRVFGQNEAYDIARDTWEQIRADADPAPWPGRCRDRQRDLRCRRRSGDGRRRPERRSRSLSRG